jgi:cGMP-dependent protein kinase
LHARQGGELWSLLYENTTALPISALGGIAMPHAVFYSSIVTCALGDLHQRGIAYRDLKPENLLVDAQGYIKLCDFGFSTPIPFTRHDGEVLDKSFTLCGTPEYLAPELVLGKGHTTAVDYWALGVLIYELLVGGTPFEDEQQPKILENIVSSQRNLQFPKGLDPHAKSLIRKLLHANPTLRLGALKGGVEDIKCHRFFVSNNLDFEALMRYGVPAPYVPSVRSPLDTTHISQEDEEDLPLPFKGDASIFARF